MAKDEKVNTPTPKVKDEWKKIVLVIDEDKPPKKYLVKGDETLDELAALAKILNELEKLKEAMLS